jgi:hypothetical protein
MSHQLMLRSPSLRSSLFPVAVLLAVSSAVLAAYVANSLHLDRFGDSPTYEFVANDLPKSFINSSRMPGYPVLIAVSSWLPGGREVGLIVTQALLILAAVAVTYFIARAALGHQWMAFPVAFVVATDLLLAGYVRVVMSETLAVILTLAVVAAVLRFMVDFRPLYLWITAGLLIALDLTRPEWILLMALVVPYLFLIARRRQLLDKKLVTNGVASVAVVFVALGAYCTGNLIVNDYFGLSSFSNDALLGKVMVYGMVPEAPAPYSQYVPMIESYSSVWELVLAPPFNDRNSALAGEVARATIEHHPVQFTQDVLGSAITSLGEHDTQFLRINDNGAFGRWLHVQLAIGDIRYRGFVILPALALAWMIAGVMVPRTNHRAQILGVLGLIVIYDWLTTAAGTYGEFERLRMPTNAISTVIVFGTLLLTIRLALRNRARIIPALALIALDLAVMGFLPRLASSTLPSEVVLLALAAVQAVAIVRWSEPLMSLDRNKTESPHPALTRRPPRVAGR